MRTDQEIREDGFRILFKYMDSVEAEKFITLINLDRFDYTKWREGLFEEDSLEEIYNKAKNFAIDLRKINGIESNNQDA